ncbi:MAG: haloalkane dehalogenase [Pseudomonadota bacterium]
MNLKHATQAVILVLASGCLAACTAIIPRIAPKVDHEADISADFPFESRFIDVLGSQLHYVDEGQPTAPTALLLHGNPTSSYLWRNIIPTLARTHRVVVPDLIGMGRSAKPDIDYTLQDHQRYITAFIDALGLADMDLVLHDWGGAIGVHYARMHPDNVDSIMMIEAVHRPMQWDETDVVSRYLFKTLRDADDGYDLIVEQNYFVEKLLPMMAGRDLSDAEMDAYRAPYRAKSDRAPLRQWPLEIPISGTPARNVESVGDNYAFLATSRVPVHFVHAEPGLIYNAEMVDSMKRDLPDAVFTHLGEGMHFLQESQPTRLAEAISAWINE